MAREILIVWVGRNQRDDWEALCSRYRERIGHFTSIRDVPVRIRAEGPESVRVQAEGEALMAALPERCWTVALDRKGRRTGSRDLADQLTRWRDEWPHSVAFLLGSDLGLSAELKASARQVLSLGDMTLPHQLARLVLYEQVYRGLSIGAGIKYHREPL